MPGDSERFFLFNWKLRHLSGNENFIKVFAGRMDGFSFADIDAAAVSVIKRCVLEKRRTFTQADVIEAIMRQKNKILQKPLPESACLPAGQSA
jgi:hypothetical protein